MSEQGKKRQKIYNLLNTETKTKNFQKNWSFFMASLNPRSSPSKLRYMGRFRKQTKLRFPSK